MVFAYTNVSVRIGSYLVTVSFYSFQHAMVFHCILAQSSGVVNGVELELVITKTAVSACCVEVHSSALMVDAGHTLCVLSLFQTCILEISAKRNLLSLKVSLELVASW